MIGQKVMDQLLGGKLINFYEVSLGFRVWGLGGKLINFYEVSLGFRV